MTNPYQPPNAAVGYAAAPLPRAVRVLRGLAVGASGLIGLMPVAMLLIVPVAALSARSVVIFAAFMILSFVSMLALTLETSGGWLFFSALVVNVASIGMVAYGVWDYTLATIGGLIALVLGAAVGLNLAALHFLRAARRSAPETKPG